MTITDVQAGGAPQRLLRALRDGTSDAVLIGAAAAHLRAHWPAGVEALARDELLAELLVTTPIYPAWLERKMTALRRTFLLEGCPESAWPLLARLAIQCHLNQYAWAVDVVEEAWVDAFRGRVEALTPGQAMALGCYVPLGSLPEADLLLAKGWTGPAAGVLEEQVLAVRQEAALQGRIQTLTPIRGEVSEAVRGQYEESPYPRWRRVTPIPPAASIFGWRPPPNPNVLFAGCGTGFHAIHARQRYGPARVLAVDLSRASLGYALRKARDAGIANIAFCQADLLELGATGLQFEAIECSGVLHHLADPFEGARVLSGLLRPGGIMKLGLYSAIARQGLKPAKALAARYTPQTIRELRRAILDAPDDDPVRAAARFSDFYATGACRDLLMHVLEHEMSTGDLKRIVQENGLKFLGFGLDDTVRAAFGAMFPFDGAAGDLDNWAAFEAKNPATFASMYQFWVWKPA